MEDQTVTLRDRDTTTQERVKIVELEALIAERLRAA
jgi:glycyl-tRNA synthetase (class II)